MPGVTLRHSDPIEKALRIFKKTVEKAGIMGDEKKRQYYDKPSAAKKKKIAAARKRKLKQDKKKIM